MRTDRKTAADVSSALYQLPGWSLGWFYATALICTWDASFILLRPHSLPGGALFSFWKPCKYTCPSGGPVSTPYPLVPFWKPCKYTLLTGALLEAL